MSNKAKRVYYLDIIRIFAILLVILMHTPKPMATDGEILAGISLLTAPCIGLLFMVSGSLILPCRLNPFKFLKRHLGKLFFPLVFWSVFYILFFNRPPIDYLKVILSFPFSPQGSGIFWFLYVLAGLYLLSPIISPWITKASQNEIKFYLGLWIISTLYPFFRNCIGFNDTSSGILYYFSGYVGYFVLGYYLDHYKIKIKNYICFILCGIPIGLAFWFHFARWNFDFYDLFWYLSCSVVSLSTGYYGYLKNFVTKKISKPSLFIEQISNCCFGVYLLHFFIIRKFLWGFSSPAFEGISGIILIFIIATLISFAIVYIVSLIPGSRYLIGCHNKIIIKDKNR